MEINEYQQLAMRTANHSLPRLEQLTVAALGLAGESGEVADIVKKVLGQGHPLDALTEARLKDELGDIMWYIALACEALNITMNWTGEANIEKLQARYKHGFSAEASRNREG